jgi:hypothetical protein
MLMSASHLGLGLPSNDLKNHKGAVVPSDMIIMNKRHEKSKTDSEIIKCGQTQGHRRVAQQVSAVKKR